MKKLYIYGCSDFGIEVETWLNNSALFIQNEINNAFNFCGFIGNKNYIHKDFMHLHKGDIDILDNQCMLIMAIGRNVEFKKRLYLELKDRKVIFPTMVHKSTIIDSDNIGFGNIFALFSGAAINTKIGNMNLINSYCGISHNAHVGNFNTISSFSCMLGNSSIKDCNHIGVGSCLLPKAQIGNNNIVAPGTYIYKRFRDNNLISGNPATATKKE